jgi:hypothetical protein
MHGRGNPRDGLTEAEREAFIEEIRAAFSDVAYPGDDALVEGRPHSFCTVEQARDLFQGKAWQDLAARELSNTFPAQLSPLTPFAFHYYLPAYLAHIVRDTEGLNLFADGLHWGFTCRRGVSEYARGIRRQKRERLKRLTPEQVDLVERVIWTAHAHDPDWFHAERTERAVAGLRHYSTGESAYFTAGGDDGVRDVLLDAALQSIQDAFADTPYPGDNNLINYPAQGDEPLEVREIFIGKKWQEITVEDIGVNYPAHLSFLSARGFCYYLPAYLSVLIADINELDVVLDSIVWGFVNREREDKHDLRWRQEQRNRFKNLTGHQIQVVEQTLRFVRERNPEYFEEEEIRQAVEGLRYFTADNYPDQSV